MKVRIFITNIAKSSIFFDILFKNRFTDFHHWDLNKFINEEAKKIKSGLSIIDIGAGELRYKKHFSHCLYKSNDLAVGDSDWDYSDIDIRSSAYNIPVGDNTFDVVLLAQVLEHLESPSLALSEASRILKPNGLLILTAPLCFEEHQIPHDYFRYTQYGLISIAERSKFKVIQIKPQGGIFMTLEYCFWSAFWTLIPTQRHSASKYILSAMMLPFKFTTGIMSYLLDFFDRKKIFTMNYKATFRNLK